MMWGTWLVALFVLAALGCDLASVVRLNTTLAPVNFNGGLPVPYNNSACGFLVVTATPGMVQAASVEFDLGLNNDRLTFYDGMNESAPLLAVMMRTSDELEVSPAKVFSSSGALFVRLTTDAFLPKTGYFDVSVVAVPTPSFCAVAATTVNYTATSQITMPSSYVGVVSYPAGITCRWLVELQPGDVMVNLRIYLDSFNVAPGDAIYVYDGPNEASPLQTVFGYDMGFNQAFLTAPVSLVKFVSLPTGEKNGYLGFQFTMKGYNRPAHCSGRVQQNVTVVDSNDRGFFYSEPFDIGASARYQANHQCEWLFSAPPGQSVQLNFETILLRFEFATMTLYDGADDSAPVLLTVDSQSNGDPYYSSGNYLFIRLDTIPVQDPGSGVAFWVRSSQTPLPSPQHPEACLPGTPELVLLSSDFSYYGIPFPNTIHTPYPTGVNCSVTILNTNTYYRPLLFIDFRDMELNTGDTLSVLAVSEDNSTSLVYSIAGRGPYNLRKINNNATRLRIHLHSVPSNERSRGFTFNLGSIDPGPRCSGLTTLVNQWEAYGWVGLNSWTATYVGPAHCTWLLPSRPGEKPQFTIQTFDFADIDIISVYDGTDHNAPLLGSFNGRPPVGRDYVVLWGSTDGSLFVEVNVSTVGDSGHFGVLGTPNSGFPSATPPCYAAGLISMDTNSGTQSIASAQTRDLYYTPQSHCVWNFTRPDYATVSTGFTMGITYPNFDSPGDSLTIYDGPDTRSPIVLHLEYQNNSPWLRNWDVVRTVSRNMLVVFQSGGFGRGYFQSDVKPATMFAPSDYPYPNGRCSGHLNIVLTDNNRNGEVLWSPLATELMTLGANMACTVLFNFTNYPGYTLQVYNRYQRDALFTLADVPYMPGQFNWTLYDGGNSSGVPILNRTSEFGAVARSGLAFLDFRSGPGQYANNTWGANVFYIMSLPPQPCSGHAEIVDPQDVQIIGSSSYPWNGNMAFPGARTCTWRITYPPRFWLWIDSIYNRFQFDETLTVHAGADASAPVVLSLSRDNFGPASRPGLSDLPQIMAVKVTNSTVLFIEYKTNGFTTGEGFKLRTDAAFFGVPCGAVRYDEPNDRYGSGFLNRRGGSYPAGDSVHDLFQTAPGTVCRVEWVIPFGYTMDFSYRGNLGQDGYLDVLQNGAPLMRARGAFPNDEGHWTRRLCGNVTFITNAGNLGFWEINMRYNQYYTGSYPRVCRSLTDVPCAWNPLILSGNMDDYAPFVNCTIVDTLTVVGSGNYRFPNLRVVLGSLQLYMPLTPGTPVSVLEFPRLTAVTYAQLSGKMDVLNFTSLLTCRSFNYAPGSSQAILMPNVLFLGATYINRIEDLRTITFDSLKIVYNIEISSNTVLESLFFPQLTTANAFLMLDNLLQNRLEAPRMSNYHTILLRQLAIPSFIMSGLSDRSISLGSLEASTMNSLEELSVANATGITRLSILNAPNMRRLNIPQLEYILLGPYMTGLRIEEFSAPALAMMEQFVLASAPYITQFYAPNLTATTSFSLSDTVLTTLSLPRLSTVLGNVAFNGNTKLATLDLCALTRAGNVSVSTCPALSCQETATLFGAAQSPMVDAVAPNCDAELLGSFGCALDRTLTVDTASCGFTLACIQRAIDASYINKRSQVAIPAGTYSGCTTPLTFSGKHITIRGQSAASTAIDCAGVGRALVVDQGEGADSELSDLTLRNGNAELGGLILIAGTSPTLRRVSLENSYSTSYGGALAVTGGGAPTLIAVTATGNSAKTGGGAVSVQESSRLVVMGNCSFNANAAGRQGGALVLLSGSTATLSDTQLVSNTAAQGGGLYSDGPVQLDHVTFRANTATQFGGGLAAVPSDTSGAGVAVNITAASFIANRAETGGGVYGFSANLHLIGGTLSGNYASTDGGGVAVLCSPSYKILSGLKGTCEVYVTLDGVTATSNTAGGNGGALSAVDVHLASHGGQWSENTAQLSGGAIYASATLLSASSETLTSNVAHKSGGGVYCEPYTGSCDVTSSTFSYNTADVSGGAAYMCTAGCPNTTRHAGDPEPALPSVRDANSFTGNAVGAGGYGEEVSTDAAFLEFTAPPDAQVVSGRAANSGGVVALRVTDAFGHLVTSSNAALVVYLEVVAGDGNVTKSVTIGGSDISVALRGVVSFNGVTLQATDDATALTYSLRARLSDQVTASSAVYVAPCAPGQGRASFTGPVYCVDCLPGNYGSEATAHLCVPCAAGYFAATGASASCTACPADTYAPNPGATQCIDCSSGSAKEGSAECSAALQSAGTIGAIAGASVGVLLLLVIGALCLWRMARRKTMQKYYLDSDATIRASGLEETPLMRSVKKIIGAASTTRAGGGVFADVYKAKHNNMWIALKVIKKELTNSVEAQSEFRREAVALSRLVELKHPGVVELVFFLERNPMCVAMEFCANGTVKNLLPRQELTVVEKIRMAAELAASMVVVHGSKIVHLDLKTDNLLLDEAMHIKLADFGISRVLDNSGAAEMTLPGPPVPNNGNKRQSVMFNSMMSVGPGLGTQLDSHNPAFNGDPASVLNSTGSDGLGSTGASGLGTQADTAYTPQYVDPLRIMDGEFKDDDFLKQTDVFSFAVVMWAIFAQEEPYAGVGVEDLIAELKSNVLKRPRDLPFVHPQYALVMKSCWHADRHQRPMFPAILSALRRILQDDFQADIPDAYVPSTPTSDVASRRFASVAAGPASGLATLSSVNSPFDSFIPPPPAPGRGDSESPGGSGKTD